MLRITDPDLSQALLQMLEPLEVEEHRAPRRHEGDFSLMVERDAPTIFIVTEHLPLPEVGVVMDVTLEKLRTGWVVKEAMLIQGDLWRTPTDQEVDQWLRTKVCRMC